MTRQWRRGPWTALLVLFVVLGSLLGMTRQAAAVTDVFLGATGCNIEGAGNSLLPFDGDDTTGRSYSAPGGLATAICNFDPGIALSILTHVRVVFQTGYLDHWDIECTGASSAVLVSRTGVAAVGTYDSGFLAATPASCQTFRVNVTTNDFPATQHIMTISGYTSDPTGPTAVDIHKYCQRASVAHPAFAWNATCYFAPPNITPGAPTAWSGTITVSVSPSGSFQTSVNSLQPDATRSTTTVYTGTFDPNSGLGKIVVSQACLPLCQSDHITMVFADTTNNQTATYTFDRTADGDVVTTTGPHITQVGGCWNATTNSCAAPRTGAASTLKVTYTWEGDASDVYICPWNFALDGGFGACSASRYSTTSQAAGTYTVAVPSAASTDGAQWMLTVVNRGGTTYLGFTVDFTGSTTTTQQGNSLKPPPNSCDLVNVGCILRELFSVAEDAIKKPLADAVAPLQAAMLAKQPFNYIARAVVGVQAQLARALTETSSTNTCPGLTVSVPQPPGVTYRNFGGGTSTSTVPWPSASATPWPSGIPVAPTFTVLSCAQLEPVMGPGTTWGDWIRPVLDPALALAFGIVQFRRVVPRLNMGS